MKKFLFLLLLTGSLQAQKNLFRITQLPFMENGQQWEFPFMGGFNTVNFSQADFNNDLLLDIFVFDNSTNKGYVFINKGITNKASYIYAPEYTSIFPQELQRWAVLRDYNCDNIPDIFTQFNSDLALYRGFKTNNTLSFKLVTNNLTTEDTLNSTASLPINPTFIPVIEDINHDGYMDILTVINTSLTIGNKVSFLKNEAGNRSMPCDSIKLKIKSNCWGKHTIEKFPDLKLNLQQCGGTTTDGLSKLNFNGGSRHITVYGIWAFDEDNDGDFEICHAIEDSVGVMYGRNGGNANFGNIDSTYTGYPGYSKPIPYKQAQGYWMDVDNDGRKDLIATTAIKTDQVDYYINRDHLSFYKNVLSGGKDRYMHQNDRFLIGNMIDVGYGAFPTLFDYNNDSLEDLIISNNQYFVNDTTYYASLFLYKNIGTKAAPKFEFVTDNYANLQSLKMFRITPTFGDLNGDGLKDLVFGDQGGGLHLALNTMKSGMPSFDTVKRKFVGLDFIYTHTAPHIVDMNLDGLNDIIIGNGYGRVLYLPNTGTKTNYLFDTTGMNHRLGNVFVEDSVLERKFNLNACPIVSRIDTSADRYLLVGNSVGNILSYKINQDSLKKGRFIKYSNSIFPTNTGSEASISAGDMNHDGLQEFMVGNIRGGLSLYSEGIIEGTQFDTIVFNKPISAIQSLQSVDQISTLALYPNPAVDFIKIEFPNENIASIQLIDLLGTIYWSASSWRNEAIDISALPSGTYIISLSTSEGVKRGKFVKQ